MLGLSFGKLLFLAIAILVVWYGFKYIQRVEEVRRLLRRVLEQQRRTAQSRAGAATGGQSLGAEELVKCKSCGAYVAARGSAACGRPDCPWGR